MLKLRMKIALLLMLMGAAAFTGAEALRSLRAVPGTGVPGEIYEKFARNAGNAAFFLRQEGDYVAVYPARREKTALRVTGIELKSLRKVDQAMIREGLPVKSMQELLQLLEDLGS